VKRSPLFETNHFEMLETSSGTSVGDGRCSFRMKFFRDQFKNWLTHNLLDRIAEEPRVCVASTPTSSKALIRIHSALNDIESNSKHA